MDTAPDPRSAKTKRTDANKDVSEYVIKSSLGSILKKDLKKCDIDKLRNNIDRRVKEVSKGYLRLSFAMNLMIRDIIASKKNPLEVRLPIFLSKKDDTFANHLMLGIEKARAIDPEVKKFLNRRNSILPNVPERIIGDCNSLTYASSQYLTNFKTYLQETFDKKQDSFLRLWTKL